MDNGVRTQYVDPATIVDTLLGNRDGTTVQIELVRLIALVAALMGPSYSTRAQLYADLAWPAGSIGYVRADATTAFNGVYKKAGLTGAGSWARIGDLPSGAVEAAQITALEEAILLLAPLSSPALTGMPTAPTAAPGTNSVQIATTAFVKVAIDALLGGAPGALDALNELASALGNDPSFATTMTNALAAKAPLASPALTGIPIAPTAAPGTNTVQLATTAFVRIAIDALIGGAPGALDTLNELAAALGDDPNFATTMTNALAAKAPLASPALTGTPSAPTAAPGTNTVQLATTAFVKAALDALVAAAPGTLDTLNELAAALGDDPNFATTMITALAAKAPLASPALTGTPSAPTAAPGTNTNQLATAAFVKAALDALITATLGNDPSFAATMAAALAAKATLASPALTGTPSGPTAAPGTNTVQLATTAFVKAALDALIAAAPGTLDTLNELAAALGDDPNFATTMITALAAKAPLASPALTGTPSAPTAAPGTNTNQLATAAFVKAALDALITATLGNDPSFAATMAAALAAKATLASPALTGTPSGPTAAPGTNTVQLATTAFVKAALDALIAAAPGTLDTLNELAAALGDDPNFATTMISALAAKAPLASPALTGTPSAPTAAPGTNTTQLATAAFVKAALDALIAVTLGNDPSFAATMAAALAAKAPLASPALTGTPSAPTAALGTNSTQLANTAFVKAALDALIAAAPGALDTLNELATALGNDPNFATTVTNALAVKTPLYASRANAKAGAGGTTARTLIEARADGTVLLRVRALRPLGGASFSDDVFDRLDGDGAALADPWGVAAVLSDDTRQVASAALAAGWAVLDDMGFPLAQITGDKVTTPDRDWRLITAESGGHKVVDETGWARDRQPVRGFSAVAIRAIASRAAARAAGLRDVQIGDLHAVAEFELNSMIAGGQSLLAGMEAFPPLSLTQPWDNVMVGRSERPHAETTPTWVPVGDVAAGDNTALNPLIATVRSSGSGTPVLTPEQIAALVPGDGNRGESPLISAANMVRGLVKRSALGRLLGSTGRYLVQNAGKSGSSILEWQQGATDSLFPKLTEAATVAKASATAAGVANIGLAAFPFIQGYSDSRSVTTAEVIAAYEALDQARYVALDQAIYGQRRRAAMFIYSTKGRPDGGTLEVQQAMLDLHNRNAHIYLIGPAYPVTDKDVHFDANGSRWIGSYLGKAMYLVLEQRRAFVPTHWTRASYRGNEILLEYGCMGTALDFASTYVQNTATLYAQRGYRVFDRAASLGREYPLNASRVPALYDPAKGVAISKVDQVADTVIRLSCSRDLYGPVEVTYADPGLHGGNGNVRDNDPFTASDAYEYIAESSMYPSANIPALVGKTYPLNNWAIGQIGYASFGDLT